MKKIFLISVAFFSICFFLSFSTVTIQAQNSTCSIESAELVSSRDDAVDGSVRTFTVSVNFSPEHSGYVGVTINNPNNDLLALENFFISVATNTFTIETADNLSMIYIVMYSENPREATDVASIVQSTCSIEAPDTNPDEEGEETDLDFSPYDGPSNDTLDALNPLKRSTQADSLSTPSGIIARALSFLFPLAGFILFIMIVWGGFEMLSQAATKKSMDAGRQRVTAAIIGFVLLFASYWIMQIVEVVFDVVIL